MDIKDSFFPDVISFGNHTGVRGKHFRLKLFLSLFQGKAKQEEPILLVVSGEEKSTTKPKEADQNKSEKDSAGGHILTLIQKHV